MEIMTMSELKIREVGIFPLILLCMWASKAFWKLPRRLFVRLIGHIDSYLASSRSWQREQKCRDWFRPGALKLQHISESSGEFDKTQIAVPIPEFLTQWAGSGAQECNFQHVCRSSCFCWARPSPWGLLRLVNTGIPGTLEGTSEHKCFLIITVTILLARMKVGNSKRVGYHTTCRSCDRMGSILVPQMVTVHKKLSKNGSRNKTYLT